MKPTIKKWRFFGNSQTKMEVFFLRKFWQIATSIQYWIQFFNPIFDHRWMSRKIIRYHFTFQVTFKSIINFCIRVVNAQNFEQKGPRGERNYYLISGIFFTWNWGSFKYISTPAEFRWNFVTNWLFIHHVFIVDNTTGKHFYF